MLPFVLHRRMDIAVHGHAHGGMAQQLAEALDIKAQLHTAGGEGMAQGVVRRPGDAAAAQAPLEMVLHDPGLQIRFLRTRKKNSARSAGIIYMECRMQSAKLIYRVSS